MLTQTDIARLLDIANAGLHKGKVLEARRVYEGILAGHPDHAPALISLALSYIVVSDFGKADEILKEQVLSKNPDDADALVYLGLSAKLAGRPEEAAEVFGRIPAGSTARALADKLLLEA